MCDRPSNNGRTHEVCKTAYGLDGFIPIALYAEPVSSLIKKIKYAHVFDAAHEAYALFAQHWPTFAPKFEMLIPLPLHTTKLRKRGFNQSELFARAVSKQQNITLELNALNKSRETVSQASLELKERKTNTDHGFVCTNSSIIAEKTIGLVDDVATTRTTLKSACEVLKKAGAKEVWAIVLAHSF